MALIQALGFIATFPLQASYHGKAKMVQRVQKTASSDMFGDEGTPIGEPMMTILDDEKAFMGPADASGTYKVDETYLTDHKIHPLQLKTIDFLASMARIGFVISTAVFGLVGWRLKVNPKTTVSDGS